MGVSDRADVKAMKKLPDSVLHPIMRFRMENRGEFERLKEYEFESIESGDRRNMGLACVDVSARSKSGECVDGNSGGDRLYTAAVCSIKNHPAL